MNKSFLCVTCLLATALSSIAVPEPTNTPTVPFQHTLAANAEWTVGIAYSEKAVAPPERPAAPRIIEQKITKVGKNRRIVSRWELGAVTETWIWNGSYLNREPSFPKDALLIQDAATSLQAKYLGNDFPDLLWVRPGDFVRMETYEGKKANYYKGDLGTSVLDIGDPGDILGEARASLAEAAKALSRTRSGPAELWTDAKTGFPIAAREEGKLLTFHYEGTGPAELTLSPGYLAKIEENAAQGKAERGRRY